jgi:3D (Asp-Asp-Asp) domain-containing protein
MYITPEGAFLLEKMNKYLKILLAAGLLAYPAVIKADTIPVTPQNSDSTSSVVLTPSNTQSAWVTAYTSDPSETSEHPLITASGNMVRTGIVADNSLPFGTQIEIPALFGNTIFTVEDRTSQKYSGRIDVWMPSIKGAIAFGIHKAQIVVLDSDVAMK